MIFFGSHDEFGRPGRAFFRRGLGLFNTPAGGGAGGGGGAGAAAPKPDEKDEEIARLKAENEKLKAGAPKPDPKPDPKPEDEGLEAKARKERELKEKGTVREKQLESAIRFTMGSTDFLKQNETLLPKDAPEIFKLAEKENYADAIEKDQAIKSALMQSFFTVQANVDLLTGAQKAILDDYLRMTKTGKQEKAQYVYDMIFEPAFDTLKRQKKAAALNRDHADPTDVEDGYKKRLMAGSKKHYFGEDKNVT